MLETNDVRLGFLLPRETERQALVDVVDVEVATFMLS
ncbi:hypothetical protein V1291_005321 [Nitrobacteraceae bacterium AZCC 1564]